MKKNFMKIFTAILFLFTLVLPYNAYAISEINAEIAEKEIVGKWKLLSYTNAQDEKTSYENDNIIWTFTGNSLSVNSKDLGGKREGSYNLVRSKYRISNTVIILCKALKATHLPHGKFVIVSIDNDILTFTDWNEEVNYILQRVES